MTLAHTARSGQGYARSCANSGASVQLFTLAVTFDGDQVPRQQRPHGGFDTDLETARWQRSRALISPSALSPSHTLGALTRAIVERPQKDAKAKAGRLRRHSWRRQQRSSSRPHVCRTALPLAQPAHGLRARCEHPHTLASSTVQPSERVRSQAPSAFSNASSRTLTLARLDFMRSRRPHCPATARESCECVRYEM